MSGNPYAPPKARVDDVALRDQARAHQEFPANPWLSIWTRPRATIQQIVDSDPTRFVLVLAALNGVDEALYRASDRSVGDGLDLPVILLAAVTVGPLAGIASLYIGGALIRWTGSWLGGQASSQHIRAALAWGLVPALWVALLWIPELLLVGPELFTTETPRMDANAGLAFALLGMFAVEAVGAVYSLVTILKCVGQVQGFSAWKALGNVLLASLVIVVPILAVVFAIGALAGFP